VNCRVGKNRIKPRERKGEAAKNRKEKKKGRNIYARGEKKKRGPKWLENGRVNLTQRKDSMSEWKGAVKLIGGDKGETSTLR